MDAKFKEILVIDNDVDFAEELVEFVRINCYIDAIYALNSRDAIELMKQNPIKIILLDYDLQEPTNGLELFPELKKIDPNVQIVFISAVAPTEVVWQAGEMPFAARMVKTAINDRLLQVIPSLLLEYTKKASNGYQEVFFSELKGGLFSRYKIDYSIISYHIIEDEYVFPNHWRTYQMINLGEIQTTENVFDYDQSFELSQSFQLSSEFELGLEAPQLLDLKSKLSLTVEKLIKSGYSEKIKTTITWMKKLSLGGDNNDPSIVSRYYDYAQLYKQIKVFIKKSCSCCESESVIPLTIYFPLASIKYRIREYYIEKEPQTIDSGVYKS